MAEKKGWSPLDQRLTLAEAQARVDQLASEPDSRREIVSALPAELG